MKFKEFVNRRYLEDPLLTNSKLLGRLLLFNSICLISTLILFVSVASIVQGVINLPQWYSLTNVYDFPFNMKIKIYHYILFGISVFSWLYWADYVYYLFKKYREVLKK